MKKDLPFPLLLVGGIFIALISINVYSNYRILKLKDDLIES
jgi:hypothetical protein